MEPNVYHYMMLYIGFLPTPLTFIWAAVVHYRWLTGKHKDMKQTVRAQKRVVFAVWFQIIFGFVIPLIMLFAVS